MAVPLDGDSLRPAGTQHPRRPARALDCFAQDRGPSRRGCTDQSRRHVRCRPFVDARGRTGGTAMNPLIDRENLRDALIAVAIGSAVALALNGCSTTSPAAPTAAQLTPEPASAPAPAPRITGAMILAQQPKEVQDAIEHYRRGAWPSFHSAHGRLTPYSERMDPVTVDCAPLHITDVLLEPGETIIDVALGDSERWLATPASAGNPTDATPHVLIKAEMPGISTNASIFTDRHTYRLALRSRAQTSLDWVQFYFPDE